MERRDGAKIKRLMDSDKGVVIVGEWVGGSGREHKRDEW